MEYLAIVCSLMIIGWCAYLVMKPLIIHKNKAIEYSDVFYVKEDIFKKLNELELDYLADKLDEADYTKMKEEYEFYAYLALSFEKVMKTRKYPQSIAELLSLQKVLEKKLSMQKGAKAEM